MSKYLKKGELSKKICGGQYFQSKSRIKVPTAAVSGLFQLGLSDRRDGERVADEDRARVVCSCSPGREVYPVRGSDPKSSDQKYEDWKLATGLKLWPSLYNSYIAMSLWVNVHCFLPGLFKWSLNIHTVKRSNFYFLKQATMFLIDKYICRCSYICLNFTSLQLVCKTISNFKTQTLAVY